MKYFGYSFFVTVVCLGLGWWWGLNSAAGPWAAVTLVLLLGVMEVSLSFDNAVVNAAVLKEMDARWRQIFLTVGILIAVFGMRLVFPILIVAVATGQGMVEVSRMALDQPEEYSRHLTENHTGIAAFGGMFLLLVFLSFLFDAGKKLHWLGPLEGFLARLGKLDSVAIVIALVVLLLAQSWLPIAETGRLTFLIAGVSGAVLYVAVSSLDGFFESEEEAHAVEQIAKRSGVMGFVYLEILDASFSFDGVIGAFAITRDVVVIMLGLGIGAMFVRSMTVYLVEKGTLDKFVYLEHGAHYAIGALAFIMLGSIVWHIPEVITGLIGVGFIVAAVLSSLAYNRQKIRSAGR